MKPLKPTTVTRLTLKSNNTNWVQWAYRTRAMKLDDLKLAVSAIAESDNKFVQFMKENHYRMMISLDLDKSVGWR